MQLASLYHRPESEFAALKNATVLTLRLRTAKNDLMRVTAIAGDPYDQKDGVWQYQEYPLKQTLSTAIYDYWEVDLTAPTKRIQYLFKVEDQSGEVAGYGDEGTFAFSEQALQAMGNYFRLPYFHQIDRVQTPDWVKQTVWYQIFPERFANGDTSNDPKGTLPWGSKTPDREDFFGGDLQGVLDHLDYLQALGVNGLYFCPLFTATSNHKYDTIDYLNIDPHFGTKELFKRVVDEAHRRGMRVMLDAVFNHIGDQSMQWQDVLANQQQSRFADWFHINQFPVSYEATDDFEAAKHISYDTFANTPHMPKLNTANPEVQDYLLNIATYWIKQFDIDAWRLDVADEVDHHFWKQFHQATVAIKPDFYILGESWHSSQPWLNGDEFHGVMNYAFTGPIKEFVAKGTIKASTMVAKMNQQLMLYRQQTNEVMFNSLDTHDTPRFLTEAGGNLPRVRAALTLMFLQAGTPCIYYGTEIGMTGGADPANRKCMIWDPEQQDQTMLAFMKHLIGLRHRYQDTLALGNLKWLAIDDEQGVLTFSRSYHGQTLTASFNFGDQPVVLPNNAGKVRFKQNVAEKQLLPNGFTVSVKVAE